MSYTNPYTIATNPYAVAGIVYPQKTLPPVQIAIPKITSPTGYSSVDSSDLVDHAAGTPAYPTHASAPSKPSADDTATQTTYLPHPVPITQSPLLASQLRLSQNPPENRPTTPPPKYLQPPATFLPTQQQLESVRVSSIQTEPFHAEPVERYSHPIRNERPSYGSRAFGELVYAVRNLFVAFILSISVYKATYPLALGAIYLHSPLAIFPIATTGALVVGVYALGMMAFKHLRSAWNMCASGS